MGVLRSGFVALGVVTASLVLGMAPAFAAGPPVPAGCSLTQGVLTCTTTTTTTGTEGPFSTQGAFVPASTVFGDYTGAQICIATYGPEPAGGDYTSLSLDNTYVTATVTTTTTRQSHGLHGKVFVTSSSTSSSGLSISADSAVTCIGII
jgi:hypothetical protein